jgi:ATP-dependent Lon protease
VPDIPLVSLDNIVLFPGQTLPLTVTRPAVMRALKELLEDASARRLLLIASPAAMDPDRALRVGTTGGILTHTHAHTHNVTTLTHTHAHSHKVTTLTHTHAHSHMVTTLSHTHAHSHNVTRLTHTHAHTHNVTTLTHTHAHSHNVTSRLSINV